MTAQQLRKIASVAKMLHPDATIQWSDLRVCATCPDTGRRVIWHTSRSGLAAATYARDLRAALHGLRGDVDVSTADGRVYIGDRALNRAPSDPRPTDLTGMHTIEYGAALAEVLDEIAHADTADGTRGIRGAIFDEYGVASTDGHRLSYRCLTGRPASRVRVEYPRVARVLGEASRLAYSDSCVALAGPGWAYVEPRGAEPVDWRCVVPSSSPARSRCEIPAADMSGALDDMARALDDSSPAEGVALAKGPLGLQLSARTASGVQMTATPCSCTGDIDVALNPSYLRDALAALDAASGGVAIESRGLSPVVLRSPIRDGCEIIMPIRRD